MVLPVDTSGAKQSVSFHSPPPSPSSLGSSLIIVCNVTHSRHQELLAFSEGTKNDCDSFQTTVEKTSKIPRPTSLERLFSSFFVMQFQSDEDAVQAAPFLEAQGFLLLRTLGWSLLTVTGPMNTSEVHTAIPSEILLRSFVRQLETESPIGIVEGGGTELQSTEQVEAPILVATFGKTNADVLESLFDERKWGISDVQHDVSFEMFLPPLMRRLCHSGDGKGVEQLLITSIVGRGTTLPSVAITDKRKHVYSRETLLQYRPTERVNSIVAEPALLKQGSLRMTERRHFSELSSKRSPLRTLDSMSSNGPGLLPLDARRHLSLISAQPALLPLPLDRRGTIGSPTAFREGLNAMSPHRGSLLGQYPFDWLGTSPMNSQAVPQLVAQSRASASYPFWQPPFSDPSALSAGGQIMSLHSRDKFDFGVSSPTRRLSSYNRRLSTASIPTAKEIADVAAEALEAAVSRREEHRKSSGTLDPSAPTFWPSGLVPGGKHLKEPKHIENLPGEARSLLRLLIRRRVVDICRQAVESGDWRDQESEGKQKDTTDEMVVETGNDALNFIPIDSVLPLYCQKHLEELEVEKLGWKNIVEFLRDLAPHVVLEEVAREHVPRMTKELLEFRDALHLGKLSSEIEMNNIAKQEMTKCVVVRFVSPMSPDAQFLPILLTAFVHHLLLKSANSEKGIPLASVEKAWTSRFHSVLPLSDLLAACEWPDLGSLIQSVKDLRIAAAPGIARDEEEQVSTSADSEVNKEKGSDIIVHVADGAIPVQELLAIFNNDAKAGTAALAPSPAGRLSSPAKVTLPHAYVRPLDEVPMLSPPSVPFSLIPPPPPPASHTNFVGLQPAPWQYAAAGQPYYGPGIPAPPIIPPQDNFPFGAIHPSLLPPFHSFTVPSNATLPPFRSLSSFQDQPLRSLSVPHPQSVQFPFHDGSDGTFPSLRDSLFRYTLRGASPNYPSANANNPFIAVPPQQPSPIFPQQRFTAGQSLNQTSSPTATRQFHQSPLGGKFLPKGSENRGGAEGSLALQRMIGMLKQSLASNRVPHTAAVSDQHRIHVDVNKLFASARAARRQQQAADAPHLMSANLTSSATRKRRPSLEEIKAEETIASLLGLAGAHQAKEPSEKGTHLLENVEFESLLFSHTLGRDVPGAKSATSNAPHSSASSTDPLKRLLAGLAPLIPQTDKKSPQMPLPTPCASSAPPTQSPSGNQNITACVRSALLPGGSAPPTSTHASSFYHDTHSAPGGVTLTAGEGRN